MNSVTLKREVGLLDGMPEKRLYWSIISDYDTQTGLCELVDNAIDLWMAVRPRPPLRIDLTLDQDRQLIRVRDTAGGVREEDLRFLIAPGASKNSPEAETIGIFGVGSKRAVVALAEAVTIKTRHKGAKSYQIDITRDWLTSDDWHIPHYEIPDIDEGVTTVDLAALRKTLLADDEITLVQHLGETYEWFLEIENCKMFVNKTPVKPLAFESWAFPPDFEPRQVVFTVDLGAEGKVNVDITAGLITDRDPVLENYGVYFYCNNRLVVKELRTREVGYFVASEAGVPHPDASLCRAIVRLGGPAKLMPWNSSKSGINVGHPLFQAIRPTLIQLVSHFSSLSRRLKDDWDSKVFRHREGNIHHLDSEAVTSGKRLLLPPLPRVNKPHVESMKALNRAQIEDQPWVLGLVEAVAAVDIIVRQRLDTRNRIALILLDSNFEIALKEFLVHRTDLFPPQQYNKEKMANLFRERHRVIEEVAKKVTIPMKLRDKAKHYYELRNKLIHEKATVGIADTDVDNYRRTVEQVLKILFDLQF